MPNITTFLGVSAEYIILGEGENIQKIELDDEPIQIRVLGKVAAGIPIEAVEDVIGEETISKKMAETGDYFGLRISGDSMEPLIHHGSIVIVRQQDDVENGDIAIVIVNGEDATCKKIEKFENGIMLVHINKKGRLLPPLLVSDYRMKVCVIILCQNCPYVNKGF